MSGSTLLTDPEREEAPFEQEPHPSLPRATVRKRRWRLSLVWIMPIVAAVVAGSLIYNRLQEFGPTITIKFRDASGVKPDQTEIRYRGVPVGRVATVELSPDHEHVVVTAELRHSAAGIAKEGALFWVVRPEVGFGSVRGLSTVLTGSYIQALPGTGRDRKTFVGLESASPTLGQAGLNVTLAARQLGSVRLGTPVFYRGVEVGSVTATELSRDASSAQVRVFIARRYARLVRVGSRFWLQSGIDVDFGLFRGLTISVDSLRSLVTGGIAFASPDDSASAPAREGALFFLNDKPRKEWLEWAPRIPIASAG